jgi:hypothetical protein
MPFRFFKPIKLGKGLHLNLSKSGLGLSQKVGPVTIGSRRTSVDLPGTGASFYTTPKRGKQTKKTALASAYIALVGGFCLIMCCLGLVFAYILGMFGDVVSGTPTPAAERLVPISLPTASEATTTLGMPTETALPLPSVTPVPPPTQRPTWTPEATWTDFPTLEPVIIIPATSPPSGNAVCACSGDLYNCSDFGSHSAAQACFNACVNQGAGDIHRLDQNNDGNACESLP